MKVYCYFSEVRGLWTVASQAELIDLWRTGWKANGWEPVLLTEEDAARHPRYHEFRNKFLSLPAGMGVEYNVAVFMRWVAVAQAGGGMMVDYDVMNYSFKPREPDPEKMWYIANYPKQFFCGAVLGTKEHFEKMCQEFYTWEPGERERVGPNSFHCCELTWFLQAFISKTRPTPPWLGWTDGCTIFPDVSGSLVHYGYEAHQAATVRKGPDCGKMEVIQKARPVG